MGERPNNAGRDEDTPQKLARRMSRRDFLRRSGQAVVALGAGAFAYTWRIEPHWVEIVERPLPIVGLPDSLVGKRIVQLSDLHAGPIVDQNFLIRSLELVAELKPDLIVLTGDFMTCIEDEEVVTALHALQALPPAPLGRLAVLGNHDFGHLRLKDHAADKLSRGMERLGVRVLRNDVAHIGGLQVVGVDDLWSKNYDPDRAFQELRSDWPTLALVHNPDAVDRPEWQPIRGWVLVGHTHGGQCKPPFLPPPMLPVSNRRYVAGEYDIGPGRRMYINRGLGYLHRVRFNARPEITAFTLRAA